MDTTVANFAPIPPLRPRYSDLWHIAIDISDDQPGRQGLIRFRAWLLLGAMSAAFAASALVGWIGWAGFTSRTNPQLTGPVVLLLAVLFLIAIVAGAVSGLNSGHVIEPRLLRSWPLRGVGKIPCVLMGLNALALQLSGLMLADHTPAWISKAALLLAIGARISWWIARGDTPPLLGFAGRQAFPRTIALTMHWCINAAVLFGLLGYLAVRVKSPQLFTASAAVAITLALVARAIADQSAISASAAKLEQALANSFVAAERFSCAPNTSEEVPQLQQALLELRAAISNSEGSKLPHRFPNAHPVHIMMVTYLCRRLGGVNLRPDKRLFQVTHRRSSQRTWDDVPCGESSFEPCGHNRIGRDQGDLRRRKTHDLPRQVAEADRA